MTNYYKQLGVPETATHAEIKKKYRSLCLLFHPDKVSGKEDEFKQIKEAYETLSDPDKRRAYDLTLTTETYAPGLEHIARLKRQGLRYHLVEKPSSYDHYQFINSLFNLQNALVPGQEITEQQQNTYWEMINYVDYNLCRRRDFLERNYRKPNNKIKQKLQLIELNLVKIVEVSRSILGCDKRKQLYDLAMGFTHDKGMLDIGRFIGGTEKLVRHILNDTHIKSADAIFALRDAGLLTPENFKQLSRVTSDFTLWGISLTLECLSEVHLVTQANFDKIIKRQEHAIDIFKGLDRLRYNGILNQKYFDAAVNAKDNSETLGYVLGALKTIGLLNDENYKIITQKTHINNIFDPLIELKYSGLLSPEITSAMLWSGPDELHVLTHHLDQLIAHGLYLFSEDVEKGKIALLLGLALKKDLKTFFEQSATVQKETEIDFKKSFIKKLHSKDNEMTLHRTIWKNILANIAIALTGVGLIAVGIQYAMKRHGFFAQTKREQYIETINNDHWLLQNENTFKIN